MRSVVLLLACQTCASQARKSQITHTFGGTTGDKLEKRHRSQVSKDSTIVQTLPSVGKWSSLSNRRMMLVNADEGNCCQQLSRRFLLLLLCHRAGTHFGSQTRHTDNHHAFLSALLAFQSSAAFSNLSPTLCKSDLTSATSMLAAVAERSRCIRGFDRCRHWHLGKQAPRASSVMLRAPSSTPPSLKSLFGQASGNEEMSVNASPQTASGNEETSVNASPQTAAETFSIRTVQSPGDLVSIESFVSSVIRESRYPISEDDPGIVEGFFLSAKALVTNLLEWFDGEFKTMRMEMMAGPDATATSFEGLPAIQLRPSDYTYQPDKISDTCSEDLPGVSLVLTCHSKIDDDMLGVVQFSARPLPPPAYMMPCNYSLFEVADDNASAAAAAAEPVPFRNVIFIKFIGVSASARRKGVASALLDWTTRKARAWGAEGVALQVHEYNKDALRFYFARGFETVPNWICGEEFPFYLLVKWI